MDDIFAYDAFEEDLFSDKNPGLALNFNQECPSSACLASSIDNRQDQVNMKAEGMTLLELDLAMQSYYEPNTPGSIASDCTVASTQFQDMRKCPKCDRICKGYKGFKQHLAKAHQNKKKQAVCNMCGKGFKHKYALKFHNRQVHERATRVVCERCGKDFYNKYMLKKHDLLCTGTN